MKFNLSFNLSIIYHLSWFKWFKWHDNKLLVAEFDSFLNSAAIDAKIVKTQICQ